MTTHYLAPHRGWAARGAEAPRELQTLVDAAHRRGLSVVMDVVFNHTATGGELHFMALGRELFYRRLPSGALADGAGCGNELATERPMVRRHVVDALRHFVQQYHVDGFRLDLGSLIDRGTIRAIERALPKRIFLTAEPWAADWTRSKWGKGDLGDSRVTLWNDDFRNVAWSLLDGKCSEDTRHQLMNAVAGSVRSHGRGWAARPSQSVNYLESHDEKTLADRVGGNKQRFFLGQVLLFTSQGVPMMGHGQEFMRTKRGISNAHNLDNEVSWADWTLKDKHQDVFEATKKLIALRAKLPHFHYARALTAKDIRWLTPSSPNALGFVLQAPQGTPGRKQLPEVLVCLNGDRSAWATFDLPGGSWKVVADGQTLQVDEHGLRAAAGTYRAPPGTAAILTRVRSPKDLPSAR